MLFLPGQRYLNFKHVPGPIQEPENSGAESIHDDGNGAANPEYDRIALTVTEEEAEGLMSGKTTAIVRRYKFGAARSKLFDFLFLTVKDGAKLATTGGCFETLLECKTRDSFKECRESYGLVTSVFETGKCYLWVFKSIKRFYSPLLYTGKYGRGKAFPVSLASFTQSKHVIRNMLGGKCAQLIKMEHLFDKSSL